MEKKSGFNKIAGPLFSGSIALTGIAALGNLALSQIHIGTITKVFAADIGFYFFLFIIFGFVTFMNSMNMRKKTSTIGNAILMLVFGILSSGVGIVYIKILLDDIKMENLLTMQDITVVLYLTIASVIIYGLGCIGILVTNRTVKRGM